MSRVEAFTKLVTWLEHKDRFLLNPDFKNCFGDLFCGLETDLTKISRLHDWYRDSHACLIQCPGLVDSCRFDGTGGERSLRSFQPRPKKS